MVIFVMSAPARKPATYEDLKKVPDHKVAQILDGELIVMPRPAPAHAFVVSNLTGDLSGPFGRGRGGPGGWFILFEPEVHLGPDILVPDVAGWRRERFPGGRVPHGAFFTLSPDWVCEVLSPSTAAIDRVRKARVYARESVQWMWIIDPIGRTLESYILKDKVWTQLSVFGPGDKVRVEPFDAIEIELDGWWSDFDTEP